MVTGWSGHHEAHGVVACSHGVNHRKAGPGRALGDLPRVVGRVGVLVDVAAAVVTKGAEFVEIVAVVHEEKLGARGDAKRRSDEVTAEVQIRNRGPRGVRSARPLRVARVLVTGVVVVLVDDQDHGCTKYEGAVTFGVKRSLGVTSERRTLISPAEIEDVMGSPLW